MHRDLPADIRGRRQKLHLDERTALECEAETGIAMTASDTSTKLSFEPPGPGSWEQDPVHFPRPMTRYFQETHPPSFKKGTNDFARFYGLLIDGLQMGYVGGFG